MLRLEKLEPVWKEVEEEQFLGFVRSKTGDWVPSVVSEKNLDEFPGVFGGFVRAYTHQTIAGLIAESFAFCDDADPFLWRFCDAYAEQPRWSLVIRRNGAWYAVFPEKSKQDTESPECVKFYVVFDSVKRKARELRVTVWRTRPEREDELVYQEVFRSSESPQS